MTCFCLHTLCVFGCVSVVVAVVGGGGGGFFFFSFFFGGNETVGECKNTL